MSRGSRHHQFAGRLAALGGSTLIVASLLLTVGATAVLALDSGAKTAVATVAPNQWTAPGNALTAGDGVYATARPANNGNLSQGYSTFSFAVPNGSIVDGITVAIKAKSTDSSGCQLDVRLSGDGGSTLRHQDDQPDRRRHGLHARWRDRHLGPGLGSDPAHHRQLPGRAARRRRRQRLQRRDANNDQATTSVDCVQRPRHLPHDGPRHQEPGPQRVGLQVR